MLKGYHQFTYPYNNNYLLNINIKPIYVRSDTWNS